MTSEQKIALKREEAKMTWAALKEMGYTGQSHTPEMLPLLNRWRKINGEIADLQAPVAIGPTLLPLAPTRFDRMAEVRLTIAGVAIQRSHGELRSVNQLLGEVLVAAKADLAKRREVDIIRYERR